MQFLIEYGQKIKMIQVQLEFTHFVLQDGLQEVMQLRAYLQIITI